MIAFRDVKEIVKITVGWERKLKDFYDVAEIAVRRQESKQTVSVLKERLLAKLEILEGIDLNAFGNTEWIRYLPDVKEDELIPVTGIRRDSAPDEVFEHLLAYEQKLKNVYSTVSESLISRNQKELFESLVLFKEEQIQEIRRLMTPAV